MVESVPPGPDEPSASSTAVTDQPVAPDLERRLVQAAQQGDGDALEQLLRDNYERIYTLCRRMSRSREQAEDATQNALIAIVRGLGKFDGRSRFSTWSYRVATNSTLDELRREARHRVVALNPDVAATGGGAPDAYMDVLDARSSSTRSEGPFADPSESVTSAETSKALADALDSLDERFRVPLVLRDVGELDYSEIAETLKLPAGTVRSRISRGRRQLAQVLAGTELDPSQLSPDSGRHSGNQNDPSIVKTDET